jgi:hypothetical protein
MNPAFDEAALSKVFLLEDNIGTQCVKLKWTENKSILECILTVPKIMGTLIVLSKKP